MDGPRRYTYCAASASESDWPSPRLPAWKFTTQKLLSRFVPYELDAEIADRAGDDIREYARQGIAISVPDAIIAATAVWKLEESHRAFEASSAHLFSV